jgi:hypothetical protein
MGNFPSRFRSLHAHTGKCLSGYQGKVPKMGLAEKVLTTCETMPKPGMIIR